LAQGLKNQAEEKRRLLSQQIQRRLVSDIEGLESDIYLIKMLIKIQDYEKDHEQAMIELAHVMGWPDPANLTLRDCAFEKAPDYISTPVEELERMALAARPELNKLEYEKQHAHREGEKAFYEAIPSMKIFGRYDRDDNMYMTEHEWCSFGLRLSWDLMAVPEKLYARRSAREKENKVALEKEVMEVTIATQVRLAALEQKNMYQRYDLVKQLRDKRMQLLKTLEVMVEKGKTSQTVLLDSANKYMNTYVQYMNTYSKIVISQARLRNALGKAL
jgi:outer membrane protein TolC